MSKTSKVRRRHSAEFKFKVAVEALKERETLAALALKYQLNPVQITQWKKMLLESGKTVFESQNGKEKGDDQQLINGLYQKIGQYQIELDWLKKKSGQ